MAAAALYLRFGDRVHYHLGASEARYLDSGVNNLLHHTAALQAQAAGCRWFHLGGGRTPDPEDSLLRFKASFSKDRLPFLTGRQVHNQPSYNALCAAWMRQSQAVRKPNYFMLYRMPLEMPAGGSPRFEPALGRVR
jgi:lipid II:glycine glycyltransferase (peptidoglycan interpeptide bridge formation enzyme)